MDIISYYICGLCILMNWKYSHTRNHIGKPGGNVWTSMEILGNCTAIPWWFYDGLGLKMGKHPHKIHAICRCQLQLWNTSLASRDLTCLLVGRIDERVISLNSSTTEISMTLRSFFSVLSYTKYVPAAWFTCLPPQKNNKYMWCVMWCCRSPWEISLLFLPTLRGAIHSMMGIARTNRMIFYQLITIRHHILVGGWATPLKNMKVNWDDYSQYMGKQKMFQSTKQ